MAAPETITVTVRSGSYPVHIGAGLLQDIKTCLPFDLSERSVFVLTDETVSNPYGVAVYEAVKSCLPRSAQMLAIPPGEQSKSLDMLQRVLAWMLDHDVDRGSVMFTVGGGVVGDLGGFAASIVMRGIPFIQVPTTLLAQVDSSVGGKTGINMPQGKNLVGAFHQPAAVICDPDVLTTVPRREFLGGYAEIVKYGLINDPDFFAWLEKNGQKVCERDPALLKEAIATSCRKKAEIVENDETERNDIRALLNLGHTFGHALEAAADYDGRLLHGEAVAIGMVLALQLSHKLGYCEEKDVSRLVTHLADMGLPTAIHMIFPPLDKAPADIMKFIGHDKKAEEGMPVFVLAKGVGRAYIDRDVIKQDVAEIIEHSMKGL